MRAEASAAADAGMERCLRRQRERATKLTASAVQESHRDLLSGWWRLERRSGLTVPARLKGIVDGKLADAFGHAEAGEVVAFFQVVGRVVGRHPVRDRIDIQPHLLAATGPCG